MCLTPVTVTRPYAGRWYMNTVPCGHCLECTKDKQNEYIIRSVEEFRKRPQMTFFTLTYSPAALPMNEELDIDADTGEILPIGEVQTLRRADVSQWLKMFKQRWKRKGVELNFAYLVKGEYGPRTQRPHFHGLIFGLDKDQVADLMSYWQTQFGYVCYKRIPSLMADVEKVTRYCAKYMVKNDDWNYVPAGAERPRVMSSQFFGMPDEKRWQSMVAYYQAQDVFSYDPSHPEFPDKKTFYKVCNEIIKRRKYNLGNGKQFKLPNYYKRKIFYNKVEGSERASQIQRMVTYNVQLNFNKDYKEQLHNLATLYDIGEYSQVVDKYNAIHEDDLRFRAQRYAKSDEKYMVRSIC